MDTFQLLDEELFRNHVQRKGIIHIGAHLGQEAETYHKMGFQRVIWIEANPDLRTQLEANVSKYGHSVFHYLLSDLDSECLNFFITNNEGHSSSMFLPGEDLVNKGMRVAKQHSLESIRFDTFCHNHNIDVRNYNCLNLDVQGAEYKVLSGFGNTLQHFDFIITEVSFKRLYRGSVLFHDLNNFLLQKNFVKLSTSVIGEMGEALYKRSTTPVSGFHRVHSLLSSCILEMLVWLAIPQFFYKQKEGFLRSMIRSFYFRYIRKRPA